MIVIPGPRQAAKLAAEYHALDCEIADLRSRLSGLTKQRDERETALLAFAKVHGEGKPCAVSLVAGSLRFHLTVAQKRSSPSYKNELLHYIKPADLQQIIDAQPLKEDLQFAAFPK